MLFESISNSQWFIQTSIILFLNKIDLFKAKLPHSPVRKYFPDYTGDLRSYKHASQYFEESFKRLNRNPAKVHTTNFPLCSPALSCQLTLQAGNLCSLYKRYRHQLAQNHNVKRPRYDSAKEPATTGTIDARNRRCGVI